MLKTVYAGELREADEGRDVVLAGWVHRRRDHGALIFLDLRDSTGIVQVVFDPQKAPDAHAVAERGPQRVRPAASKGTVQHRRAGTENDKLPTGAIEVHASGATVLNAAKTPPFYINEEVDVDETLRLRYRYLDLRRERMHNNIVLRAPGRAVHPRLPDRARLRRDRDAGAGEPDAGGRRATTSCPAASTPATSTRCRSRRSSSSSC